jgi:hypothetical protein
MIRLPSPPQSLGDCRRVLSELIDRLYDLIPQVPTPNTLLQVGSRGNSRHAQPGGESAGDGVPLSFKGQWDNTTTYDPGDLVIVDTNSEQDSANLCGLYVTADGVTGGGEPASNPTDWALMARGNWPKLTFITGDHAVIIDSGRDGGNASIRVFADKDDETAGSVKIDVVDLAGLAAGDDKVASLKTDTFCVGTTIKRATWLRTGFTDLP